MFWSGVVAGKHVCYYLFDLLTSLAQIHCIILHFGSAPLRYAVAIHKLCLCK